MSVDMTWAAATASVPSLPSLSQPSYLVTQRPGHEGPSQPTAVGHGQVAEGDELGLTLAAAGPREWAGVRATLSPQATLQAPRVKTSAAPR